jgi:hypothetical protein
MVDIRPIEETLGCPGCDRVLGVRIVYDKEQRLAYRLFAEAVTKKIVRREVII